MSADRFVVSFTRTEQDWRAYYRFIQRDVIAGHAWDQRGVRQFHMWTAAMFGGVIGLVVSGAGFDPLRILLAIALASAFGVLYARSVSPGAAAEEDAFVKAAMGQREGDLSITLTAAGVEVASDAMRSDLLWTRIHRVERTDEHVYLMYAPQEALFVPLRAFREPSDADAFCAAAARFHAAAQPRTSGQALGFPVLPPVDPAAPHPNTAPPDDVT